MAKKGRPTEDNKRKAAVGHAVGARKRRARSAKAVPRSAKDPSGKATPENPVRLASIGKEVELYTRHIDSLRETLPTVMIMLAELAATSKKSLDVFENAHCKIKLEELKKTIQMPLERHKEWTDLNNKYDRLFAANILVPRSIFVALVSQYDAFLGRLLRAIFILRPEMLSISDRQISFSQLMSYTSLDEAREFVIEKEVESVLRSSHADQFKWMEQRFGLPLRKGLETWPQFIELTERRNLFVHTDGVVSRQYLTICKEHGFGVGKKVVEGGRLGVVPDYFMSSCDCVFEVAIKLAHVLWRKLVPQDREHADINFISITYELIETRRYELACNLLDFAIECFKTFSNEWAQLAVVVNRAQAYKWVGKIEKAKQIMAATDWSAKGDEFKLADKVLAEKWDDVFALMKQIGSTGPLLKTHYRDWPLFQDLRKQPKFLEVYEKIFGEKFYVDVPIKSEQTPVAEPPVPPLNPLPDNGGKESMGSEQK